MLRYKRAGLWDDTAPTAMPEVTWFSGARLTYVIVMHSPKLSPCRRTEISLKPLKVHQPSGSREVLPTSKDFDCKVYDYPAASISC